MSMRGEGTAAGAGAGGAGGAGGGAKKWRRPAKGGSGGSESGGCQVRVRLTEPSTPFSSGRVLWRGMLGRRRSVERWSEASPMSFSWLGEERREEEGEKRGRSEEKQDERR